MTLQGLHSSFLLLSADMDALVSERLERAAWLQCWSLVDRHEARYHGGLHSNRGSQQRNLISTFLCIAP